MKRKSLTTCIAFHTQTMYNGTMQEAWMPLSSQEDLKTNIQTLYISPKRQSDSNVLNWNSQSCEHKAQLAACSCATYGEKQTWNSYVDYSVNQAASNSYVELSPMAVSQLCVLTANHMELYWPVFWSDNSSVSAGWMFIPTTDFTHVVLLEKFRPLEFINCLLCTFSASIFHTTDRTRPNSWHLKRVSVRGRSYSQKLNVVLSVSVFSFTVPCDPWKGYHL